MSLLQLLRITMRMNFAQLVSSCLHTGVCSCRQTDSCRWTYGQMNV